MPQGNKKLGTAIFLNHIFIYNILILSIRLSFLLFPWYNEVRTGKVREIVRWKTALYPLLRAPLVVRCRLHKVARTYMQSKVHATDIDKMDKNTRYLLSDCSFEKEYWVESGKGRSGRGVRVMDLGKERGGMGVCKVCATKLKMYKYGNKK